MSTYYITKGSVRGSCGHRHETIKAAYECMMKDHDLYAQSGGRSDRIIMAVDEHERSLDKMETVQFNDIQKKH
jgi:hypothetical protein